VQRGGRLFLRFDGYDTEEEEPLRDLKQLRFSSLAAEAADCARVGPGTRLTGFKRSGDDEQGEAIWVDAEVVSKQSGPHARGRCDCR
jgi:hypothetical protein